MGNDEVQIVSRDFWFKIVDFLQQNWALIDQQENGKVRVFFVHDASGVFDTMVFESEDDAEQGLLRNGFKRFADDQKTQKFICSPKGPFVKAQHPNGPIYSSGRFWR